MTPCGPYGSFCCGQDSAARACCDAGNNTLLVGGGEAICNGTFTVDSTTTSPATPTNTSTTTTCSNTYALESTSKTERNTIIALAVALGFVVLMLGMLSWDWWTKKKLVEQIPGEILQVMKRPGCFR